MKTKLLKIGVGLLVSGLIIFTLSAYAMELGHTSGTAFVLSPALILINFISVFVAIPICLMGTAFVIGSLIPKFHSFQIVYLIGGIFVIIWLMFILSRFS